MLFFYNPGSMPESPNEIEQARRDAHSSNSPSTCFVIHYEMDIPNKWRTILYCRNCKRNLTSYVASAMLELVPQFLATEQEFNTNISENVYGAGTCGQAGMWIKNDG